MKTLYNHARQQCICSFNRNVPVFAHSFEYAYGTGYLNSVKRTGSTGEQVVGYHDPASMVCHGYAGRLSRTEHWNQLPIKACLGG